jgi:asparagine synthase (glutamine-hydrolysing)
MKVIMQNPNIKKTLNLNALDDYFAYGYILGAKTIYNEIQKLPPAHYLTVDLNKGHALKIERYWKINFESNDLVSEKEWTERIVAALTESIKMQMISDVPLGAFLSGGIDSSSVVALMAQQSSERIKTFSIGFKEKEFNELDYAREVSVRYNTEHYEQIIEPESVSLLPKLVRAYDEPFADSSAIPTYYVSKFAREHVTVVLSGDGGDELFAGYNAYSRLNSIKRIQKMPDAINKMLFIPLYYSMPYSMRGKKVLFYASQPTRALGAYFTIWMNHERAKLFRPEVWNELKKSPSELQKELILSQSSSTDFISQLQELDMQTYLVDDILTKVDRASMMNSLEVRVPMLDFKFAELSYKIPSYLKLHRGDKKYIFKKAMEPYLPESILKHKKQGFAVPLKVWFRKDLNDFVHDTLLDKKSMISDYLNANEIKNVLNSNASGGRNLGPHIWSLLFLETWLNQANGKA